MQCATLIHINCGAVLILLLHPSTPEQRQHNYTNTLIFRTIESKDHFLSNFSQDNGDAALAPITPTFPQSYPQLLCTTRWISMLTGA